MPDNVHHPDEGYTVGRRGGTEKWMAWCADSDQTKWSRCPQCMYAATDNWVGDRSTREEAVSVWYQRHGLIEPQEETMGLRVGDKVVPTSPNEGEVRVGTVTGACMDRSNPNRFKAVAVHWFSNTRGDFWADEDVSDLAAYNKPPAKAENPPPIDYNTIFKDLGVFQHEIRHAEERVGNVGPAYVEVTFEDEVPEDDEIRYGGDPVGEMDGRCEDGGCQVCYPVDAEDDPAFEEVLRNV